MSDSTELNNYLRELLPDWKSCEVCGSEAPPSHLNKVENLDSIEGVKICDDCMQCGICKNFIPANDLFMRDNRLFCDSCSAETPRQNQTKK